MYRIQILNVAIMLLAFSCSNKNTEEADAGMDANSGTEADASGDSDIDGDADSDADADMPPPAWMLTIGGDREDRLNASSTTSDQGMILVGTSESFLFHPCPSNTRCSNIWAVKVKRNGKIGWQKHYAGGIREEGWHVIQTQDKGFLISGTSRYHIEGTDNEWKSSVLILKLDKTGAIQWNRILKDTHSPSVSVLAETSDNGFIFAGARSSLGDENTDIWMVKFGADMNIEWQRTYGTERPEYPKAVTETPDSGFVVLAGDRVYWGPEEDVCNLDFCNNTIVLKVDTDGKHLWSRYLGDPASSVYAQSITGSDNGCFIIGCIPLGPETDLKSLSVIKLTNLGRTEWQKGISYGPDAGIDFAGISYAGDNGLIMAGTGYREYGNEYDDKYSLRIHKLDEDLSIEWQKEIRGRWFSVISGIWQNTDGTYSLASTATHFSEDMDMEEYREGEYGVLRFGDDVYFDGGCDLVYETYSETVPSDIQNRKWSDLFTITEADTNAVLRDFNANGADTDAEPEYLCP